MLKLATPFVAILTALALAGAEAPAGGTLWEAWEAKDIGAIGDDNSGSSFALSDEVMTPAGRPVLQVTPSGEALETKLALDFSGEGMMAWAGGDLLLEVYLPPENDLSPTHFFLGLADVTGEWQWVDGVFSETAAQPGWNRVRFPLSATMRRLEPENRYTLFMSFFYADDNENKTALETPFYLGSAFLAEREEADAAAAERDPAFDEEAAALLRLDDEALLEEVARRTFDFFWLEANPENGLVKDRSTPDAPSSIAAVGFALAAIPVAVERGWISRDEGYERALTTLNTFAEGGVEGERGFFFHFVAMETGERVWTSELSSIDTALFIAGALTVGEYFNDTEVEELAHQLYRAIDWQWMMAEGDTVSMGWMPESGFLDARWSNFDEGLLLYVLGIGSPTHPLPPESWDAVMRPVRDGTIYLPAETLFVYQYPLVWLDLSDKEDRYANYFNNAARACERNREFAIEHQGEFASYREDVWGLSASDGPFGYKAYGAAPSNHDGTVAPYAPIACLPFTPGIALGAVRRMLREYGSLVWGRYGFVSAINEDETWYSTEYIGIDQGDILLMIENYRSGLVWELFMQNEHVQRALGLIGFEEREADYAVTPSYAAELGERAEALRQPVTARRAGAAVTVDGDLADWQGAEWYTVDETMNVPAGDIAPVDPQERRLQSRFAVLYDDRYLYLAAEVTDNVIVSNIAPDDLEAFYRTDSVEFYLDPGAQGSGTGAGLYKLAVIPFDTEGKVQAVRHEDARPGPIAETSRRAQVASSRTEEGYLVEVAVPLAELGVSGEAGSELGFSHVLHNSNALDAETGAYARENILGWNPVPNVWADPSAWSRLRLE